MSRPPRRTLVKLSSLLPGCAPNPPQGPGVSAGRRFSIPSLPDLKSLIEICATSWDWESLLSLHETRYPERGFDTGKQRQQAARQVPGHRLNPGN